jgi:hypothetical protein
MEYPAQPPPALRPFGSASSALDVPFDVESAPQLVTCILQACTGDDPEKLSALSVGRRIELLLRILAVEGEPPLWIELRCLNEVCGESIEVDLAPVELIAIAGRASTELLTLKAGDGQTLHIRRPTGRDQLRWQAFEPTAEGEGLRLLVGDLIAEPGVELDDALVAQVDTLLAETDPLACFELSIACPFCREVRAYELDLARLALERFRALQTRLVDEIHALASGYNWSEAEILAVPPARRALYLARLERGAA